MFKSIIAFCAAALFSLASMTAMAQDDEGRVKVKLPWGAELSAAVQGALQSDSVVDELQGIVVLCNTADTCQPAGAKPMRPKLIRVKPATPALSDRKPAQDAEEAAMLSPGEQKSRGAVRVIRGQPRMAGEPTRLAAGDAVYQCTEEACTCSGTGNCIAMVATDIKCRRRTVQCTEKGCRCTPRLRTR